MTRLVEVHPDNPQQRLIAQVADSLREGALVAYPTDSGYALGCQLGNAAGIERIKRLRQLDDKHHFTLVCADFAQLGQFVRVSNSDYRLIRSCTPGPFTFILPATREVPRRLMHPKKKTVGVRLPDNAVALALLADLGEPLMSATLIMPGDTDPLSDGAEVAERVGAEVDVIVEAGFCGGEPTTVIDLSQSPPEVVRQGSGDTSRLFG